MKTEMTIMLPGSPKQVLMIELGERPSYETLRAIVAPVFGKDIGLERVAVLYRGARCDMLVDESSRPKGLPRNEDATPVYRTNWMSEHPEDDPETIADIRGPAVLFDRRVWF